MMVLDSETETGAGTARGNNLHGAARTGVDYLTRVNYFMSPSF